MDSATPAYSLTGLPAQPGCPLISRPTTPYPGWGGPPVTVGTAKLLRRDCTPGREDSNKNSGSTRQAATTWRPRMCNASESGPVRSDVIAQFFRLDRLGLDRLSDQRGGLGLQRAEV